MSYNIIKEYQLINKEEWSKFVTNHKDGCIFHLPEMVELYRISDKHYPLVIACNNEFDKLVGLLIADIHKEYNGILGRFSTRAIIMGGPLVNNQSQEIINILLNELDSFCKKKVLYTEFRFLFDVQNYFKIFSEHGYSHEDHLDILFNLKRGKDVLWNNIHPTRKKQINRGIKREVYTKIKDDLLENELFTCYDILKNVYKEAQLPFPSIIFFSNAIILLNKNGYFKAILAYYNNQIIGFRFFLTFNGMLYDWYAGSSKNHYDKYPNDILPWEILKWGSENEFHTFDFGGAGKPNIPYGVRDYKMKFGGELVNFGRSKKIHNLMYFNIARFGFYLLKKIKYRF